MVTTLGCWSDAAAWASCRNRLRRSSCRAMESFMTLMATVRSRTESLALYTTPIAPSPTSSTMWYLPMSGILTSVMVMQLAGRIGPVRIFSGGDDRAMKNGKGDGGRGTGPGGKKSARQSSASRSSPFPLPSPLFPLDRRRYFAYRLDDRLASLEQHALQIEIALHPSHHVVADHPAIAKIDHRLLLRVHHRRTHTPIFLGAPLVDHGCFVRGGDGEVLVRDLLRLLWAVGLLVLFPRRPSPSALSMPLLQVANYFGIGRVGDRRVLERLQPDLRGCKTRVRLLRALLGLISGADAQQARDRSQRRPLEHQRDEYDGEGDENDLLACRKSCPRSRRQRQGQGQHQRVSTPESRPGDEQHRSPRRQRLVTVAQPPEQRSEDISARHHPDDANPDDDEAHDRGFAKERRERQPLECLQDVRQLQSHQNEDEALEHERDDGPHAEDLQPSLCANDLGNLPRRVKSGRHH